MKSKRFIIITVVLVLVAAIFTASINIVVDPLYQYHTPKENELIYLIDEKYQNPGVAKNFEFDTAIIGNSMTENFRASWFDEAFDSKTVKLSSSGAYSTDYALYLDIISKKKENIKTVTMNVDMGFFINDWKNTRYKIPMYLYDANVFNDLSYLLNFDILYSYTYKALKNRHRGIASVIDEAYVWDNRYTFGKETVLSDYSGKSAATEKSIDVAIKNADNILNYTRKMPNTRFIMFFSPYSILYWYSEYQNDSLEDDALLLKSAIRNILEYDNVEYYFWVDEEMLDIICDLNNYKDTTHYSTDINRLMLNRFVSKEGILTKENYEEKIDYFFEFLSSYDYDLIFE